MTVPELIRELERHIDHDPPLDVREAFFSPVTGMKLMPVGASFDGKIPASHYVQLRVGVLGESSEARERRERA